MAGLRGERIAALLAGAGLAFSELAAQQVSLEAAYLQLTRESVEYTAPQVQDA